MFLIVMGDELIYFMVKEYAIYFVSNAEYCVGSKDTGFCFSNILFKVNCLVCDMKLMVVNLYFHFFHPFLACCIVALTIMLESFIQMDVED